MRIAQRKMPQQSRRGVILMLVVLGWYRSVGVVVATQPDAFYAPRYLSTAGETDKNVRSHTNDNDGWSTIQVYYGDKQLLRQKAAHIPWTSQSNQDKVVASLFQNKTGGYFVELAANDAVDISNSYALERNLQWNGLCIEANPRYWRDLSFRDCQVVGAVVGKRRDEQIQFEFGIGWNGGIVNKDFDNTQATQANTFYTVPLEEILKRNGAPNILDYLSLDVEGAETYVMESFPFDRYTVRVITIERPKVALRDLLRSKGYKLLKLLSAYGETLWVHESQVAVLDIESLDVFDFFPDQAVEMQRLETWDYSNLQNADSHDNWMHQASLGLGLMLVLGCVLRATISFRWLSLSGGRSCGRKRRSLYR